MVSRRLPIISRAWIYSTTEQVGGLASSGTIPLSLKKILSFASRTSYTKSGSGIKTNASANRQILRHSVKKTSFIIEKWLVLSIVINQPVFFLDKNDFIC
jgi:hypothetical protein